MNRGMVSLRRRTTPVRVFWSWASGATIAQFLLDDVRNGVEAGIAVAHFGVAEVRNGGGEQRRVAPFGAAVGVQKRERVRWSS